MISQDTIDRIRRLLTDGKLSQRQIAERIGVSRGTVCAVATGQREERFEHPEYDWDRPAGPIVRCPTCGGLVFSPCQLCRVRDHQAKERADRRRTAGREPAASDEGRRRFDPRLRDEVVRRS